MQICSSLAFVAQADDSGHTVSWPKSALYPTTATCPASSGAMASHRCRSVAPAAGSSHARSVTSAPIAAPSPIGSRPSRRTVRTTRGDFCFVFWPPPFFRACSIAARNATRARSTPVTITLDDRSHTGPDGATTPLASDAPDDRPEASDGDQPPPS